MDELTRKLVDAYNRGGREATMALVHEDAVAVVPDGMPNAGMYRGHAGVGAMLDSWEEAWESFSVELADVQEAGDAAIASVVQRGRGRGSGVDVELRLAWIVRGRDGRLVHWQLCESVDEARQLVATA